VHRDNERFRLNLTEKGEGQVTPAPCLSRYFFKSTPTGYVKLELKELIKIMNQFKVCISESCIHGTLYKGDIRKIERSIAKSFFTIDDNQIKSFINVVVNQEHPFCPSTFKDGIMSRETFEQAQLFVLSFDSQNDKRVSFERIKARARYYGLPILFAYNTYSLWWTETRREQFSIVFLNEIPLYDLREAEAMQKALMMMFPEADEDCSVLKLHKGTEKLLYFDESVPTINSKWLMMNMCLRLQKRFGPTNYKRKIAEYARETGVLLNDRGLPDVSLAEVPTEYLSEKIDDKNSSKCITKITGSDKILSHLGYKINFKDGSTSEQVSSDQERSSTSSPIGSDLLKSLSSSCKLYQEFESGSRELSQQELLGLASNLSQV